MSDRSHCPFTDPWSIEAWLERVAIMIESGASKEQAYKDAEACVVKERMRRRAEEIAGGI